MVMLNTNIFDYLNPNSNNILNTLGKSEIKDMFQNKYCFGQERMRMLRKEELENINGGGAGLYAAIVGGIIFLIGVIDGVIAL